MVGWQCDDQLCRSGRGAIVVCYGEREGRVTANFGGCQWDDQLCGSRRGAIPGCPWHPTQQWHPEQKCRKTALSFLQRLHLFSTLITQKLVFAIRVYAGIIFVACLRFSSHGQFRHVVSCFDLLIFKFHWILLWIERLGAHRCDSDTLMYELSKRTMKAICVGLRVWNKGLR